MGTGRIERRQRKDEMKEEEENYADGDDGKRSFRFSSADADAATALICLIDGGMKEF